MTCTPAVSLPTTKFPHALLTGANGCDTPIDTTTCLSNWQYNNISLTIQGMLGSISSDCTSDSCPQADWAGCVLRVAGHDFMDYDPDTNTGGSNGCIDMSHPENAGLADCLLQPGEHGQSLAAAYNLFCSRVSLADFLVISAEAVMTATRQFVLDEAPTAARVNFSAHFLYGRTTSRQCEGAGERIPNSEGGCPQVQVTYLDSLGLSWRQSAALMGVHTLGRALSQNSGYAGWWTGAENARKFDNSYYISLRDEGWVPMPSVCGKSEKNQWVRSGPGGMPKGSSAEMMLNTDLCLAYDIPRGANASDCCAWIGSPLDKLQVCGSLFQPDCGSIQELAGSAGSDVSDFASDEATWLREFQVTWTKATSNGFSSLSALVEHCPGDDCTPGTDCEVVNQELRAPEVLFP